MLFTCYASTKNSSQMKRNNYWIAAGILNLFTAFLHLIGGQVTLVDPLMETDLLLDVKSQLWGAWHMVTVMLFGSSYILLQAGWNTSKVNLSNTISSINFLYITFSIAFIISSLIHQVFTPQWILLLPIGLLGFIGLRKHIIPK